jgi:hypothetical protein
MIPDAAASSDVPSEAPCEAAGATALADDSDADLPRVVYANDADLRRVIQNIKEEQRNADLLVLE